MTVTKSKPKHRRFTEAEEWTPPAIDWEATYAAFEQEHGGNPVPYASRLLFADGWMHSADDPKGPQFPPPVDGKGKVDDAKLRKLQHAYWSIRKWIIKGELIGLQDVLSQLSEMLQRHKAPLMIKKPIAGTNALGYGITRWEVQELTADMLQPSRMSWLQEDLELCERRIEELR